MKMLSFRRHEASKMEPERVPGSSYLAVLWMAGCGQRDMGVEGDMVVPGRADEDDSERSGCRRPAPGRRGVGEGLP